ncbi:MAG: hypothetical protein AB1725_01260 [Armatimonadota bacterium]
MSAEKRTTALGRIAWATVLSAIGALGVTILEALADPDVSPVLGDEFDPLPLLGAVALSLLSVVGAVVAAPNLEKERPCAKSLCLIVWAITLAQLEDFISGLLLRWSILDWNPEGVFWSVGPREVATFVVQFLLFAWIAIVVIGAQRGSGVRSKVVRANAEAWSPARVVIGGLMAAGLWAVTRYGAHDMILWSLAAALEQAWWPEWLGSIPQSAAMGIGDAARLLPFTAAALLYAGWLAFAVSVDSTCVRVHLHGLGITLFRAPWERIRRVDLITHTRRAPTAVIHYWSRFRLPFSFGVHGKHFTEPERVVGTVVRQAEERALPVRQWKSPDAVVWVAWASLIAAFALVIAMHMYEAHLWRWYIQDDFDLRDFAEVAAYVPLASLNAGWLLLAGIGAGLLSAYHRAGARPVLAALFILAVYDITGPLLHWLVWTAIYAILVALRQPLVSIGPVGFPSAGEIDLAMALLSLAPAFVGFGYVLGVLVGCRRARPGEQEVGVPAKLSPRQPTAAGEQRAG